MDPWKVLLPFLVWTFTMPPEELPYLALSGLWTTVTSSVRSSSTNSVCRDSRVTLSLTEMPLTVVWDCPAMPPRTTAKPTSTPPTPGARLRAPRALRWVTGRARRVSLERFVAVLVSVLSTAAAANTTSTTASAMRMALIVRFWRRV